MVLLALMLASLTLDWWREGNANRRHRRAVERYGSLTQASMWRDVDADADADADAGIRVVSTLLPIEPPRFSPPLHWLPHQRPLPWAVRMSV